MEPTHPDKLVENVTAPSAGGFPGPDREVIENAATFSDDLQLRALVRKGYIFVEKDESGLGSCLHLDSGIGDDSLNALIGGVAEWSIAPVLKTGGPLRVPWVRIPPPPPCLQCFRQPNAGTDRR